MTCDDCCAGDCVLRTYTIDGIRIPGRFCRLSCARRAAARLGLLRPLILKGNAA